MIGRIYFEKDIWKGGHFSDPEYFPRLFQSVFYTPVLTSTPRFHHRCAGLGCLCASPRRSELPTGDRPIPATDAPGLPMNRQNTSPRVASPPRAIAISGAEDPPTPARTAGPDAAPQSSRANAPMKREAVVVIVTGAGAPPPPRALASRTAPLHCRLARPGGLAGHAARRSPSSRVDVSFLRRDAAFDDGRRFRLFGVVIVVVVGRRARTDPRRTRRSEGTNAPFRIARPSPSSTRMPGCVSTGASVRRGSDERGVEPEDESRRQRGPPRRYGGGPRARGGDRLPVCKSPHREKWSMASRFCRRRASLASSRAAVVGRSSSSRFDRSRSLRATSAVVVVM